MHHWKKVAEEPMYQGWRRIIRKRFELPDGRQADFDIIGAGNYVTVAALTGTGEFVLVRQYRPGPEQVLLSFAEGGIDAEETPEEAARRELLEETGFEAAEVVRLRSFRSSYTNQEQFCLLATGCRKVKAPEPDENEVIEVVTLPVSAMRELLRDRADGSFSNVGCAYMALEYLKKL